MVKCVWFLFGMVIMNSFSLVDAQDFLIIGHRGACGYAPENTLASFAKALELGTRMVEFDVYRCKSGELVVIHDNNVKRVTQVRGFVEEMTLDELKKLRVQGAEKIPTLDQVLDFIDRRMRVNIEIKGRNVVQSLAQTLAAYVEQRGWVYSDFLVSSADQPELMHFKELCSQVKCGVIISGVPLGYALQVQKLGVSYMMVEHPFIHKELVGDAHQRGLKIFGFTVNDVDDCNRLKLLGVDGVFSNFPDRFCDEP